MHIKSHLTFQLDLTFSTSRPHSFSAICPSPLLLFGQEICHLLKPEITYFFVHRLILECLKVDPG